jgi:hypothetical protein
MRPLDAFWHLLNFFMPALAVGMLAAGGAKLLWRRELTHISWRRLAAWPSAAGAVMLLGGLAAFGRDGRMATYAAMLLAAALALWWAGFASARR